MFVAKVLGSVVATQKVATMTGHKLLLVEPYRLDPLNRTALWLGLIPRHFGQQETHTTPIGGSGKDQSAPDKPT